MKTHLLCMGSEHWLVTLNYKNIIDKDKLESYVQSEKDLFMYGTLSKEELISTLLESEFEEVKSLKLLHEFLIALHKIFEVDAHAKKVIL